MTDINTRTFFILLTSFVALMVLVQSKGGVLSPSSTAYRAGAAYKAPPAPPAEPLLARKTSAMVELPLGKCAVSWVNGGNFVLATPSACTGVSVQEMTIRASAKPCAESRESDFRRLTNTTYFKGDFGFFLGQDAAAGCLIVDRMLGRSL